MMRARTSRTSSSLNAIAKAERLVLISSMSISSFQTYTVQCSGPQLSVTLRSPKNKVNSVCNVRCEGRIYLSNTYNRLLRHI